MKKERATTLSGSTLGVMRGEFVGRVIIQFHAKGVLVKTKMFPRLSLVAFLVCYATALAQAQSGLLQIGDTISTYMLRNLVKFKVPAGRISQWSEGQHVILYTYQRGADSLKPAFLSADGMTFGVLEGVSPNAYYLFDTDGDGILDYRTTQAILPIWIVGACSKVIDTSATQVNFVLDTFYNSFQSDSGLSLNPRTKPAYADLFAGRSDTLYPNRDLFYMLYCYISQLKETPSLAMLSITTFEKVYAHRFGHIHPLIKLDELEGALELKDTSSAREYLSALTQMDPQFIPAKYYACVLERDKVTEVIEARELKSRFPNHWLIKQLK